MATEAQIKANRYNAKKSAGPKTTEGKEKSSQNAIRHGLTANQEVLCTESREEHDLFRQEMLDDLNPIGPAQYRLAGRIASLSWRLRRAEIMHDLTIDDMLLTDQTSLYDDMLDYRVDLDTSGLDLALGHMAAPDFARKRVLDRLIMYERRIENSLYKTMNQLKRIQNEPNSTPSSIENPESRTEIQNKPNLNQAIPQPGLGNAPA